MIQEESTSDSAYDVLTPLMRRFDATCSPKDFYWAVNGAFHAAESKTYDLIHEEMYAEEQAVWARLVEMLPKSPSDLTVLDIGCGTGLVGGFLSRFCANRIGTLHLLDPSAAMLSHARKKSQDWRFSCQFYEGDVFVDNLPEVDVVTVNSVLHHVVELESLFSRVQTLLKPGGVFLTSQDPRGGANEDDVLNSRRQSASARSRRFARISKPLAKVRGRLQRVARRLTSGEKKVSVSEQTNTRLISEGVIGKPMDMPSIWAVTDFHIPNQPGGFGHGINLEDMKRWMPQMQVQLFMTYHFHDISWTSLSESEQNRESAWLHENDLHGRQFASSWVKSSSE